MKYYIITYFQYIGDRNKVPIWYKRDLIGKSKNGWNEYWTENTKYAKQYESRQDAQYEIDIRLKTISSSNNLKVLSETELVAFLL
jgi:hypothetical protein